MRPSRVARPTEQLALRRIKEQEKAARLLRRHGGWEPLQRRLLAKQASPQEIADYWKIYRAFLPYS